jgi:hypothetical protein
MTWSPDSPPSRANRGSYSRTVGRQGFDFSGGDVGRVGRYNVQLAGEPCLKERRDKISDQKGLSRRHTPSLFAFSRARPTASRETSLKHHSGGRKGPWRSKGRSPPSRSRCRRQRAKDVSDQKAKGGVNDVLGLRPGNQHSPVNQEVVSHELLETL